MKSVKHSKKRIILCVVSALLVASLCFPLVACDRVKNNIEYTELGIPLLERYPGGGRARCPSDIELYDGKLYVGSGDFDANWGPVDIWCYNTEDESWELSGTVEDEEVSRFRVINGELFAAGIDPKGEWDYGNYYKLVDGGWQTFRSLPNGVHNFDLIAYEDMFFAALGVEAGNFPIVRSFRGGSKFYPVAMLKDGKLIETDGSDVIRVLDFILFDDTLYAIFYYGEKDITYELYRYDDGVFVYEKSLLGEIYRKKISSHIIDSKIEYDNKLYFSTGYLYVTEDMNNFERLSFPNSEIVYDLYRDGKWLYALCGETLEDGTTKVSVWRRGKKKNSEFKQVFNFIYEVPPLSIAVDGDDFYIGMGSINTPHAKNGTVLLINK